MARGDGGGRPSKFTPERRKAILESIKNRIPYVIAAQANGISERTFYDWMNQGEHDYDNGIESEFATFSQSIKKIEQERINHHLDKIDKNVKNWQADAWILERRWYKHFGQNVHAMEMDERLRKLEEGARNEKKANEKEKDA